MSEFSGNYTIDRIVPACPYCNQEEGKRNAIVLIDVIQDWSEPTGTQPVWSCGDCKRIFGRRDWEVKNELNSFQASNNSSVNGCFNFQEAVMSVISNKNNGNKTVADSIRNDHDVKNAINNSIQSTLNNSYITSPQMQEVERGMREIQEKLTDVGQKVKKLEEESEDVLLSLRKRVRKFSLV